MEIQRQKIPEELKNQKNWVMWKWETRKGKLTKPPFQVCGKYAKSTDPKTWTDYETVCSAFDSGKWDGFGFMLDGGEYTGIDWDDCRDKATGEIDPEKMDLIRGFDSYTEVSPSGAGLKTLIRGKLPKGGHHNEDIGVFDSKRFFCITGQVISEVSTAIEPRQTELDALVRQYWPGDFETVKAFRAEKKTSRTDADLISKAMTAKNGDKFTKLWNGETTGYDSHSEADLALCSMLAFYFDNDRIRIDAQFRQSGLMRQKWNRENYREETIAKAISGTTETYSGKGKDETTPGASGFTPEEIMKALHAEEDGDASIYIRLQRGKFCFDHAGQVWYRWAGHYWEQDLINNATAVIQTIIDEYADQAERQGQLRARAEKIKNAEVANRHKKKQEDLFKRIRLLHKEDRKGHVLRLAAAGSDSLGITGNEWDSDPRLLGCQNGVFELKTGNFRPGHPVDYIKTVAGADWAGIDAPAPMWEKFLIDIFDGDQELIDYVQRLYGYGITGLSVLHIIVILYGIGRNGKGTLTETIKHVLGGYAYKAESEILLEAKYAKRSGAPDSGLMALRGKRIVTASETSEGSKINASKVKEMVGGDTLNARAPYGRRQVEFTPTHLLFLMTNNKPAAPASDFALWERIKLIPFKISFVADPQLPNQRTIDLDLPGKLKSEASGIIAWCVRGCMAWQQSKEIEEPESVRAATRGYQAEEDILQQFINERCEIVEHAEVKAGDLYRAYRSWTEANGHHAISQKSLGKEMRKRFDCYEQRHIYFMGIKLHNEDEKL